MIQFRDRIINCVKKKPPNPFLTPQATRDQGARGAASSGYQYDRNGNLTYDPGRGVTVSYNHLNLPRLADFGGGKRIEWTYDAGGRQLRKQVLEIGA